MNVLIDHDSLTVIMIPACINMWGPGTVVRSFAAGQHDRTVLCFVLNSASCNESLNGKQYLISRCGYSDSVERVHDTHNRGGWLVPTSNVKAESKSRFRYCRNSSLFEMTIVPSKCSELLGPPATKRQSPKVVREVKVTTFSHQYQRPASGGQSPPLHGWMVTTSKAEGPKGCLALMSVLEFSWLYLVPHRPRNISFINQN